MAVRSPFGFNPNFQKPPTEEIPKELPKELPKEITKETPSILNDYVDMNLPNGARISAQGQLVITVITLSFVSIYCCEKVYQVTCRVLERINANPENQR